MVRVYSVYHFQSQHIKQLHDVVVDACAIAPDTVAIARQNNLIEIEKITSDDNNPPPISFPTVDEIEQLIYGAHGNYLATVEVKNAGRRVIQKSFYCRVYTNWGIINGMKSNDVTPIRARIAGKTTPTSNGMECLEVIEIPIAGDGDLYKIACCQMTGNLLLAKTNKQLLFYRFIDCIKENTKCHYIDFSEIPIIIELDFQPDQFQFNEQIVACLGRQHVHVFKIVDLNEPQIDEYSGHSLTSAESNSMPTSSLSPTQMRRSVSNNWHREECLDYAKLIQEVGKRNDIFVNIASTFEGSIDRKSSDGNVSLDCRPIMVNDMELSLRSTSVESKLFETSPQYATKSLLQLKLFPYVTDNNPTATLLDPFKSIALKPIYMKQPSTSLMETSSNYVGFSESNQIFKSKFNNQFIGFAVLVATSNDGYLYQYTNNEKWNSDETHCIATYSFTSVVMEVLFDDYALHAITDRGIETYTHRIGHKIFSNTFEYFNYDDYYPMKSEICPRVEEPICLISLRPYSNVRKILRTPTTFILMTSDDTPKDYPTWIAYKLALPDASRLFNDFISLARSHKKDSVSIYHNLCNEAHMIIRCVNKFLSPRQENLRTVLKPNSCTSINDIYLESCCILGDYYAACCTMNEYSLAMTYYQMGQLGLAEVFTRAVGLIKEKEVLNQCDVSGIIYTVKSMFLKLKGKASRQQIEDILSKVEDHSPRDTDKKNCPFGEKLLGLFSKYAPYEISTLVLNSAAMRDCLGQKIVDELLKHPQQTPEEMLCIALHYVNNNRIKEANKIINGMSAASFGNLLIKYNSILFDISTQKNGKEIIAFSMLTEHCLLTTTEAELQQVVVNVFAHLVLELKVFTLDTILKLFMDYLPSLVVAGNGNNYKIVQNIFMHILEIYLNNSFTMATTKQTCDISLATTQIETFVRKDSHMNPSSNSSTASHSNGKESIGDQLNDGAEDTIMQIADALSSLDSKSGSHGDIHMDSLKILTRIYMGVIRQKSAEYYEMFQNDKNFDRDGYRKEFLKQMRFANVKNILENHRKCETRIDKYPVDLDLSFAANSMKSKAKKDAAPTVNGEEIKTGVYPLVLFAHKRPLCLNRFEPFKLSYFKNGYELSDQVQHYELLLSVQKLQALLCSGRLSIEILQEIVTFLLCSLEESSKRIVGMDSFITLLLPVQKATEYLFNVSPQIVLEYAKSIYEESVLWTSLLRSFISKIRTLKESERKEFMKYFIDTVEYISDTMVLSVVIQIYPVEEFQTNNGKELHSILCDINGVPSCNDDQATGDIAEPNKENMTDNMHKRIEPIILEENANADDALFRSELESIFIKYLCRTIDRDRSERLRDMIKTTGHQLFETLNKNKAFEC